jgi:hypothetical protein
MKITKNKIKEVIKKEYVKILKEQKTPPCDPETEREYKGQCFPASPTDLNRPMGQTPGGSLHEEDNETKDRLEELISDYDMDPPGAAEGGFFLSLVREAGKFLSPREQELAEELRQAVLNILLTASSNAYKAKFNEEKEEKSYPNNSTMRKLVKQAKMDGRYKEENVEKLKKDYDKHVRGTLRDPKHSQAHKK